ncbi:MAG: sugar transferase [Patescibacteria group bacterium]|nr:sugar transferase [Patescibacteria group bacterium]
MRIRRLDLTFTALLLPLDALALFAAAISAYSLRFSRFVTEVRPILQDVNFSNYISAASLFVLIWIGLFALAGLYSPHPRKAWNELGRIIITCGAGTMVVIATVFFRREITTSRFIVLAVLAFSILYVLIGRLFLRTVRHLLLNFRVGHKLFVVIGSSAAANDITATYKEKPVLGLTIVRQFKTWNNEAQKAILSLKQKDGLDGIILADPEMDKHDALELIAFADENHLTFRYLADLFAAKFTNIEVMTDSGLPVIEVKRTPLDGWGRIAKRAFDVIFAIFFLILFSPLILISCLALIIEDGLPVIFQNERVGEGGRIFRLYKLRSMWRKFSIGPQFKQGTKERLALEKELIAKKSIKEGPVYKIADDPRITPVGMFIRRWSIDELPQFWNVLKGDMSIVGPRPHQIREVAGYKPHQRRVFAIRPGITGMAQISGRSDLEFEDEVRLDAWYIENWSLWLDIYIVLKTPFAVLYRKGAY